MSCQLRHHPAVGLQSRLFADELSKLRSYGILVVVLLSKDICFPEFSGYSLLVYWVPGIQAAGWCADVSVEGRVVGKLWRRRSRMKKLYESIFL